MWCYVASKFHQLGYHLAGPGHTRSYQVAFSSASPRLCWLWWPGDSGWVKKRPELPTWRGQSIHVQQIFELFWCPVSSDVQRHIDEHWLLAEECCGMLRMREDDFSGMKFLRGSDVFGATKFLTHQGDPRGTFQSSWDQQVLRLERTVEARVDTHSLRTMTNYIWIHPWKGTGTPNKWIETVENHFQFDRSSFTSPLVN